MLPMAGRTAGPIKTKLGIGTHAYVNPRSVLVKVKLSRSFIYGCSIIEFTKEFMTATPGAH